MGGDYKINFITVISMTDKKTNPLWNILKSVRLTLFLLALLAAASIIGTLIGGQDGIGIYHSLWFRLIIFCLAVNLIVCSIDRFPAALRRFRLTPAPDRTKVFEDATPRSISLPGAGVEKVSSTVQGYLRSRFNKMAVKDSVGASFIYCEKGRFSLFSVYLVHLSVLFILIGAIIGSIFGFDGYVYIPEGGSRDRFFTINKEGYNYWDLGFSVQCEKFLIDYYEKDHSEAVKEYRSDLNFFVDNKKVLSKSLLVNHPIKFMGVTFYQADYDYLFGDKIVLKITDDEKGDEETAIVLEKGKDVTLPDNKGEVTLSEIKENLMDMMGPAALINIKSPDGQETPIWLFPDMDFIKGRFPEILEFSQKFNPSAYSPFTFELDEIETIPYTVLQVARDPGVPLVFIGFILIVVGLFLTFFASHRRFWIRVTDERGEVKINLAGTANKNQVGMERELDRLLIKLKAATEGKHNG